MFVCLQVLSGVRLLRPHGLQPPGSSVHRILQARILEWVAISSSRGSSQPKDLAHVSCVCCIDRWILCHCTAWEAHVCLHCSLNNTGKYKEESKSCEEKAAAGVLLSILTQYETYTFTLPVDFT